MVTEWCKDGCEGKDDESKFSYTISLPNPYDLEGPWIGVGRFNSPDEMLNYAKKTFGADKEGKIDICEIIPEGE
jgi:hypothetical protein